MAVRRVLGAWAAISAGALVAAAPGWTAQAQDQALPPVPPPVVAKSSTGSYVVLMKDKPIVATVAKDDLDSATAKAKRATLRGTHRTALAKAKVAVSKQTADFTNAANGFAVRTDYASAQRLARDPTVLAVLPDELRQATEIADTLDAARKVKLSVNGLNTFLSLTGSDEAYRSGVDGRGVLVGVIDTGVWPENAMLADDGTMPPAPSLDTSERSACDFGNTAWNPNDKPFTCNNKLVGAREFLDTYKVNTGLAPHEFDSARDNEGHGTHTATTAAGDANVRAKVFNVDKGVVSGIAPRAQVIAYKALGDAGGYTSDLAAAIDQAVADGVDVINYSIGGGAQVVSADTIAFLYASSAGVFTSVSAGNSGPSAQTIGGPADVPWVTAVGATTHPTFYQGKIELGSGRNKAVFTGASITRGSRTSGVIDGANAAKAGAADANLCLAGSLDPAKVNGKIVLCGRGKNGRIEKSFAVASAGGVGMVLYNQTDADTLFSDNFFVPALMTDATTGSAIRDWVAGHPRAYGKIVNTGVGPAPFYTPNIAYFSSRGENAPAGDIVKPDIAAPGVQILAGNTPMPVPGSQPAGQNFQAIAGTSMSAPVVAGLYALLKQQHPGWSAATAKSALMTTAATSVKNETRTSAATPFMTGSGLADVGKPAATGSAFNPGLVYDADFVSYLGFLCAEGREAFVDAAATCASLQDAGVPTTAANLNYPSIGIEAVPGTTSVQRSLTNVTGSPITVSAMATAPSGYTVAVSPSTLTVAPGATESFTVKVTNTSAPLGQWRFGSLVWSGDGYSLHSPIAVKGTAIAAPAAVTGAGTSGSATVTVNLGVGGSYEAVPHGLVPVQAHEAVISQDPDHTYPSPDDTDAGVVKIPYTVDGVSLARWSLVLPGDDDLDLFLLDSAGKVVASSTNGGTDELIQLIDPADGTYTLVVHGWAVASADTAFSVKNWLVPSATGGSLTVTSGSPATVSSGDVVTLGIAWSGLTAGNEYLGSISHVLNGTTQATTVVSVTG
ncbi:MAG: S8 family serine peptidase [Nostocoides sp.]